MKVNYVCTKCGKAGNYAAYLKYCRLHGRTPDSLITMCGAGLKSDH